MRRGLEALASRRPHAGIFWTAVGGALLALSGHLALLDRYGTVLPYRDQWKCTAVDLLGPWVNGTLSWSTFFEPLNDHWPVLTRVLSFALVRINGQWNNLLETSVNALLFSTAAVVFLLMVLPGLFGWTRAAFAVLTGVILALPITWENTLWGVQSLVYFQLVLSLVYFAAVATSHSFSRVWWAGHVAGAALLLTMHSAVLAHIAVALLLVWRLCRSDGNRKVNLAGLAFAGLVIVLFIGLFPRITDTSALRADTWAVGIDVFLRQLAYPLPHPAWALFLYLPWVAWMLQRLTARRMEACDAFILVTGLWIGAQAAAIGYARGAATYTFVSRYCDFLALGFLLNAACIARLALASRSQKLSLAWGAFALIWLITPIRSFHWESTQSHAGYNLSRRAAENQRNLAALSAYYANGDTSGIADHAGRGLYSYPPELMPLLQHESFQQVLPPETGSPRARKDHGRLGWIPASLLTAYPGLAIFGLLVVMGSGVRSGWSTNESCFQPFESTSLTRRGLTFLFGTIGAVATVGTLVWDAPNVFNRQERLRRIFHPEGITAPLTFKRGDVADHPTVAPTSGVETMPVDSRDFAYGTRLPVTPDFRGIIFSNSFRINNAYLNVPFTGYPCADGNGLRWRIYDPATKEETWISYVGPNPGVDWGVWGTDVTPYSGREASLYLYDGREDAMGWVGIGQPAQANDAGSGAMWLAQLRTERTDGAHRALAGLATFSLFAVGVIISSAVIAQRRTKAV
jgi:hypothetical protein